MKPKSPRSPERIALEEKIGSFIHWSLSILIAIMGLILTSLYFNPTINQHEVLTVIRYQLVIITTAVFCCPLTPIPAWFPFPPMYRVFVVAIGFALVDLIAEFS
jgi:hypothetical protein